VPRSGGERRSAAEGLGPEPSRSTDLVFFPLLDCGARDPARRFSDQLKPESMPSGVVEGGASRGQARWTVCQSGPCRSLPSRRHTCLFAGSA
jgi:hypothetical protein